MFLTINVNMTRIIGNGEDTDTSYSSNSSKLFFINCIDLSLKSYVLEDNRMKIGPKRNENAYFLHHFHQFCTVGKQALIGTDMCYRILCFFVLEYAQLWTRQDNERKTHRF